MPVAASSGRIRSSNGSPTIPPIGSSATCSSSLKLPLTRATCTSTTHASTAAVLYLAMAPDSVLNVPGSCVPAGSGGLSRSLHAASVTNSMKTAAAFERRHIHRDIDLRSTVTFTIISGRSVAEANAEREGAWLRQQSSVEISIAHARVHVGIESAIVRAQAEVRSEKGQRH